MIRSNLCNIYIYIYIYIYIIVSGNIPISGSRDNDVAQQVDERNKRVIIKKWATFTEYISSINNTQIDNAKDIDVVIPIYDLIE